MGVAGDWLKINTMIQVEKFKGAEWPEPLCTPTPPVGSLFSSAFSHDGSESKGILFHGGTRSSYSSVIYIDTLGSHLSFDKHRPYTPNFIVCQFKKTSALCRNKFRAPDQSGALSKYDSKILTLKLARDESNSAALRDASNNLLCLSKALEGANLTVTLQLQAAAKYKTD